MEQHPVPQNVTTFQFRLIGDMTLKQFGYLATFGILAYIFYKLPLPFFITWPLAVSSAVLGVGLAFVPIEERPMDVWIMSFLKNVYSPTQFVWKRSAADSPQSDAPQVLPGGSGNQSKKSSRPRLFGSLFQPPKKTTAEVGVSGHPVPVPRKVEIPTIPPVRVIPDEKPVDLDDTKHEAQTLPHTLDLEALLFKEREHRKKLEGEIAALQKKLDSLVSQPPTQSPAPTPSVALPVIQPPFKPGLPKLTTFPNVVTGIVKDSDGNLLPGVLITVRDREETPLRALKTNKLGQFAASTPLPNGEYLIEAEDPRERFAFEKIAVALSGSLIPTLEITARSQREIARAKLEKQIFGAPPV
ncbi:MAG: PrgI family protein [bacterium]|nr:PrgI family protein [bacterium]